MKTDFNIKKAIGITGVLYALFTIWSNSFGMIMSTQRNSLHLAFVLVILFLKSIEKKINNKSKIFDYVLLVISLLCIAYFYYMFPILHRVRGSVPEPSDIVIGAIFIVILLEVTRRAVGPVLPIVAVLLILYARYGQYLPGLFSHPGYSWQRIIFRIFMTSEGIWGSTLEVSATFIAVFVLFGCFLEISGSSTFFKKLALVLTRRWGPAGAAQGAMIGSAIMGTMSGSAAANVATTGSITIPLMKRLGFKPEQAGAIEAVASTGGMIMPPIMGAAAFLMASILGLPYVEIVKAAVLPAVLYYLVGMVCVQLMTKKHLLNKSTNYAYSEEEKYTFKDVFLEGVPFFVSVTVIVIMLLSGKSETFTGFMGIVSALISSLVFRYKEFRIQNVFEAMKKSAESIIEVATVCACAGIIVMVITSTGAGAYLAQNLISIAGGNVFFILVIIGILSLFLTMGMPCTALYIVMVTAVGSSLLDLGVEVLAMHFFMFWYGVVGNLTPPVAMAIITASGISGAGMWQIAPIALRLGIVGFTIPFMFVFFPELLGIGVESWGEQLRIFCTCLLGGTSLAIALENYFFRRLHWFERLGYLACSVLLLLPDAQTDIIGFVVFIVLSVLHKKTKAVKLANDMKEVHNE